MWLDVSFSASATLSEQVQLMVNSSATLVAATSRCETAQVARDTYDPKFVPTKAFMEAVMQLPPKLDLLDLGPWIQFIETFGTHMPTQLSLGGLASKMALLSPLSFRQTFQFHLNLAMELKVSVFILFGIKITKKGAVNINQYYNFSSMAEQNITWCKPTCPLPLPQPAAHRPTYTPYVGYNAFQGRGAVPIDTSPVGGMSVAMCEARCNADPACGCVAYLAAKQQCWKRKHCVPGSFEHDGNSAQYTVYVKSQAAMTTLGEETRKMREARVEGFGTCNCAGVSNAQGQGGVCEAWGPPTNDGPPGVWCYVAVGACADGQPSDLAGYDWSSLACLGPPVPSYNPNAGNRSHVERQWSRMIQEGNTSVPISSQLELITNVVKAVNNTERGRRLLVAHGATAEQFAAAADSLATVLNGGHYCGAVPGCGKPSPFPLWVTLPPLPESAVVQIGACACAGIKDRRGYGATCGQWPGGNGHTPAKAWCLVAPGVCADGKPMSGPDAPRHIKMDWSFLACEQSAYGAGAAGAAVAIAGASQHQLVVAGGSTGDPRTFGPQPVLAAARRAKEQDASRRELATLLGDPAPAAKASRKLRRAAAGPRKRQLWGHHHHPPPPPPSPYWQGCILHRGRRLANATEPAETTPAPAPLGHHHHPAPRPPTHAPTPAPKDPAVYGDIFVLDLNTHEWQFARHLSTPRAFAASCIHGVVSENDFGLYVLGGYEHGPSAVVASKVVDFIDPAKNFAVTRLPDMPVGLALAAAVSVPSLGLFVLAGTTSTWFDTAGVGSPVVKWGAPAGATHAVWTTLTAKLGMHSVAAAAIDADQVFIFGGFDPSTQHAQATVQIYRTDSDRYLPLPTVNLPYRRAGASAQLVGSSVLVVGGFINDSDDQTTTTVVPTSSVVAFGLDKQCCFTEFPELVFATAFGGLAYAKDRNAVVSVGGLTNTSTTSTLQLLSVAELAL